VSRHLLVMACSATKIDAERAPLIDLYDGPTWRTLRAFERAHTLAGVDVLALSAQYGLVPAEQELDNYDRRMTHGRAITLRESTERQLMAHVVAGNVTDVFVLAGKDYMPAFGNELDALEEHLGVTVTVAAGGIGHKMAALKAWLKSATTEEVNDAGVR
jgi:hypothetical protein